MSSNDLLLLLLLLVGCVSAACLLCFALPNLRQEQQALDKCKEKFFELKDKLAERKTRKAVEQEEAHAETDAYLDFLDFFKRLKKDEQGKIVETQHFSSATALPGAISIGEKGSTRVRSSYIADRLFVILCSVSTANLVRKAPTLTDLHELTQQQERGEFTTALFRALTPSMLVIGILGTLIGVHNQLRLFDANAGIEQLVSALGPGIMAVLGTIICIVLRGVYNNRYAAYTTQLDEFTLKHLLPFFRPKGELQADVETFKDTMEDIINLDYDDLGEKIADYQQSVNDCHRICRDLPLLCGDGLKQLATLERSIQTVLRRWKVSQTEIDGGYAEYTHLARRFSSLHLQTATDMTALAAPLQQSATQGMQLSRMLRNLKASADADWCRMYVASRTTRNSLAGAVLPDHVAMVEKSEAVHHWLQEEMGGMEVRYAEAAAPTGEMLFEMAEQMHMVSKNAKVIDAYRHDFVQELAKVKPQITRSREERVSMWHDAAARLTQWLEKHEKLWGESAHAGSYPKGWAGIHMRLRDALSYTRSIFYTNWWGKSCGVALIVGFLVFLYWV